MPQSGKFENRAVSRKAVPVEQDKLTFDLSKVARAYMCNFWNFCQWPSVMLKYGNF